MQRSPLRASLVLIILAFMAVGGFACGSNTPLPTYTPAATYTPLAPLPTHTPAATYTPLAPLPTHTPAATYTPLAPLPTHTPAATYTPLAPLPTHTPAATYTPLAPLPTHTPAATYTPLAPLPTYTPAATYTPLPTYTPVPTATHTPSPSPTPQPTDATTPAPAGTLGFESLHIRDGEVILEVRKDGPMDLAGIEPGDVLLEVNGRSLRLSEFDTATEAFEAIPRGPAGTSATFLVRRASNGQTETIEVTRDARDLEYTPLLRRIDSPVPIGMEYPPLSAQSSIESIGRGEVRRGWSLRVVSVVPNATDLILAASRSEGRTPTPPEEGKQYFTATISAKYIGAGSNALTMRDLDAAGDATNIVYEAGCGDRYFNPTTIPNALPANTLDQVEVLPGGTIEGVVCWEIDSRDAPTLKMRFDYQFRIVWGSALSGQAYYFPVWYDLSPSP